MGFSCFIMQDCEDHAVLLCSLLLGFGLNAYVCVGTKAKGAAHTWVMTVSPDGEVAFWESLTAHRCLCTCLYSLRVSLCVPLIVCTCTFAAVIAHGNTAV